MPPIGPRSEPLDNSSALSGSEGDSPTQPVYAVQFEVRPPEGKAPGDLPEALQALVTDWVRTWYRDRRGVNVDFPKGDEPAAPLPRHTVEISTSNAETGERWWKLVWTYPVHAPKLGGFAAAPAQPPP